MYKIKWDRTFLNHCLPQFISNYAVISLLQINKT